MLDLKKYVADIEDELENKGMTVEMWAVDEKQAEEKLNWLVTYPRKWKNLCEVKEEE